MSIQYIIELKMQFPQAMFCYVLLEFNKIWSDRSEI